MHLSILKALVQSAVVLATLGTPAFGAALKSKRDDGLTCTSLGNGRLSVGTSAYLSAYTVQDSTLFTTTNDINSASLFQAQNCSPTWAGNFPLYQFANLNGADIDGYLAATMYGGRSNPEYAAAFPSSDSVIALVKTDTSNAPNSANTDYTWPDGTQTRALTSVWTNTTADLTTWSLIFTSGLTDYPNAVPIVGTQQIPYLPSNSILPAEFVNNTGTPEYYGLTWTLVAPLPPTATTTTTPALITDTVLTPTVSYAPTPTNQHPQGPKLCGMGHPNSSKCSSSEVCTQTYGLRGLFGLLWYCDAKRT